MRSRFSFSRWVRMSVVGSALALPLHSSNASEAADQTPTSPNAEEVVPKDIAPEDARKHQAEIVRVTFLVRKAKKSEQTKRTYLDSELDYKDPKNFGVLIEDSALPNFAKADISEPHVHYKGRTIRVVGKPFVEDGTVFIRVERPDQIEVIRQKAKEPDGSDSSPIQ